MQLWLKCEDNFYELKGKIFWIEQTDGKYLLIINDREVNKRFTKEEKVSLVGRLEYILRTATPIVEV